jgi:hypothetical protein
MIWIAADIETESSWFEKLITPSSYTQKCVGKTIFSNADGKWRNRSFIVSNADTLYQV